MTAQSDQDARSRAWPTRVWLGLVVLVVVARLPVLATSGFENALDRTAAVGRSLRESASERVARTSAITPELIAAIRSALPADGRLVLYSPYPGADFEFLLRSQFERTKNLLYPHPRDVHFARGAQELRSKVDSRGDQSLLVVDYTQEPVALTIGGDYELVHTESIGGGRMRLWRLVKRS